MHKMQSEIMKLSVSLSVLSHNRHQMMKFVDVQFSGYLCLHTDQDLILFLILCQVLMVPDTRPSGELTAPVSQKISI